MWESVGTWFSEAGAQGLSNLTNEANMPNPAPTKITNTENFNQSYQPTTVPKGGERIPSDSNVAELYDNPISNNSNSNNGTSSGNNSDLNNHSGDKISAGPKDTSNDKISTGPKDTSKAATNDQATKNSNLKSNSNFTSGLSSSISAGYSIGSSASSGVSGGSVSSAISGGKELKESWSSEKEQYLGYKNINYRALLYGEFCEIRNLIRVAKNAVSTKYNEDYGKTYTLINNYNTLSGKLTPIKQMSGIMMNNLQDAQSEYNSSILIDGQPVSSSNKPSDIIGYVQTLQGTVNALDGHCQNCSAEAGEILDDMVIINNGYNTLYTAWGETYYERYTAWEAYKANHEDKKNISLSDYWSVCVMLGSCPT